MTVLLNPKSLEFFHFSCFGTRFFCFTQAVRFVIGQLALSVYNFKHSLISTFSFTESSASEKLDNYITTWFMSYTVVCAQGAPRTLDRGSRNSSHWRALYQIVAVYVSRCLELLSVDVRNKVLSLHGTVFLERTEGIGNATTALAKQPQELRPLGLGRPPTHGVRHTAESQTDCRLPHGEILIQQQCNSVCYHCISQVTMNGETTQNGLKRVLCTTGSTTCFQHGSPHTFKSWASCRPDSANRFETGIEVTTELESMKHCYSYKTIDHICWRFACKLAAILCPHSK